MTAVFLIQTEWFVLTALPSLDLSAAFTTFFTDKIGCFKIPDNLSGIFFWWSTSSSFHGIHLHFVRKSPFTGRDVFSLQVGIDH